MKGSEPPVGRLLPEHSHPPTKDLALLSFAVLCGSTAPPLMAALAVPAVAIAFWRNALALVVVWPTALLRQRGGFRALTPRVGLAVAFAAAMLGLHFAGMATALQYTSVASAAALVCSQSIWAALFARVLGERLPPLAWVGTLVALSGVVAVTGVDLTLSRSTLLGNALAVVAGMAGGAYMVTGGVVRRRLGVHVYTAVCYTMCALMMLALAVALGQDLWGYSAVAWSQLVALTVLAQLLGHSLFNFVMRSVSPSFVSLGQLFTMPVSALLAAIFLRQAPPLMALPALALMLAGTAVVVLTQRRRAAVTEGA
ncbi:DMT family transporter [Aquipuribacter nitratireducens]|uniref:DMT family transporter n=1 Tax=Aquipuribacter nitratireducens TaxID=650104 RepID=A0ABW0GQY0_9MICO